jgi:hypothetical protein
VKAIILAGLWASSLLGTWWLVRETPASRAGATDQLEAPVRRADIVTRVAPCKPALLDGKATVASADDGVFRSALATLERDVADGRWSVADRDRLNIALPQVSGDQAEVLFAVLLPKLNSGELASDIDGPPL